ncbi:MAG: tetraacyldisaccharide 4'-kinase, partial [Candidatus Coatesbacteria bacterium]
MELIFKIALFPIYVLNILYNTLRRELYYAGVIRRKIVLKKAVISIGNINLGGAGKTPLIIYIARRLVI